MQAISERRAAARLREQLESSIRHTWRAMQRHRRDARGREGVLANLDRKWAQIDRNVLLALLEVRRAGREAR